MLIEYYKRRNARLKGPIYQYNGKGQSIRLDFGVPAEVDDQWGYKILSDNADIIRLVVPKEEPDTGPDTDSEKPKKKKK